ncbi:cilia- and flagella-associated protein 99 [Protopterus annectens]|uniref:cilia- and flagella-associated protein 99 n=1 Tax=Protopterus annectens TaxID=7888 RepID=UPI001CFB3B5A|nr:cilia- and flagella-associated protein 99 [Protopterus annectens]
MTNYGKLMAAVIQLLNRFDPENQSVEHFLEKSAKDLMELYATEEAFVLEVLAGCIQYRSLLDVVVEAFYVRDGINCLLSERNLFNVICYLATFQLEELGMKRFTSIIKSQDTNKMYKFLRFFFNVMHLSTWILDEWSLIYEAAYVKETWINPLLRWQPKVETLISHLGNIISNHCTPKKDSKTTKPKEYNLTKPKPRAIPVPEKIPQQQKTHTVPSSTYRHPKELQQLDEIKQQNRQKAEEMLLEANSAPFKCASSEKSESAKHVLLDIAKEEESKMSFKARPFPGYKVDNIPIKLNTAAILREGLIYQRREEEELHRIENLLEGSRDSSKFLEWQKQMREKDMEQQLADIERRRLEGKLSYEEAVLARQKISEENKKKAVLKKEETAELMRQYAEKRLQEEKDMRDLVQQVEEGHKNAKQAKIKLQEYKQRIVQEVTEESRELLREALARAEEELCKKLELIRQIQTIESVPVIRHKFVDLTETAGYRLLSEMSIVELRERLALLREAQRNSEEEKRDQILNEKKTKEQFLLDKLQQISLHRAELSKAAAERNEARRIKSQTNKSLSTDEHILELQKQLEEKRNQRKKQSERDSKGKSNKSWKAHKKSLEEQHWEQQEKSRERQIKLLHSGMLSTESSQKIALYQAARIGASSPCVSRS